MSVDDSCRLKKRVYRNASGKPYAPFFQIIGDGIREDRAGVFVARLKYYLSPGEIPDITVKRALFLLNGFDNAAVADGGFYFFTVADDGAVFKQTGCLLFAVVNYFVDIKVIKSLPERFAAVQYALPRKSGLETLQNKQLIEHFIIMQRDAPLLVVVLNILMIIQIYPETTQFQLRFQDTFYKIYTCISASQV